jgi:alkylation response protein AidB-like acyl-CoA dehydrogenase
VNFDLSDEQRAFQDSARAFAAKEMAPHAARWDEEKIFPVETLRAAAHGSLGWQCNVLRYAPNYIG